MNRWEFVLPGAGLGIYKLHELGNLTASIQPLEGAFLYLQFESFFLKNQGPQSHPTGSTLYSNKLWEWLL